jgi:isoquinoline 1-oxidoreductase beta subunit
VPDPPRPSGRIGKRTQRLDTPAKVNGTAAFGLDVRKPGMLYAAVRSAPTLSGRVGRFDEAPAKSQKGVERVFRVDRRTVAVVADSYWTAQRAVDGLPPETFEDQKTSLSTKGLYADFARQLAEGRPCTFRNDGNAHAQLAPPRQIVKAKYCAPYLAHLCMEPLNCTARFTDDGCELWLGTQAPGLVACAVARKLCLWRPGAVVVNTTLLGGGFGRRLEVDVAVQAARIAKEFRGKAVKLIWSREEDIRRDVFRPAAYAELEGAVGENGMPFALLARVCSQSVNRSFVPRNTGLPLPFVPDKTNVEGLFDQPYDIPNYRVEHVEVENEVPVGNWRAVGHGFNGFAMECFLDELAHVGHKDPFDVRRHLLAGPERQAKVDLLDRLKEFSDWKTRRPEGVHGRGMAYRQNFNSDVAQVVDVAVESDQIKVKRVYCVIDCGRAVDCSGIEAQVQSGIVYGLSAALMQAITIKDGRVQQLNLHQFDALRIHQCPEIHVCILQNNKRMGGAGETAVPPVAPALANAVADATGRRLRELPLSLSRGAAC